MAEPEGERVLKIGQPSYVQEESGRQSFIIILNYPVSLAHLMRLTDNINIIEAF